MAERYTGEVRDGAVVLDPGSAPPPDGSRVHVEVVTTPEVDTDPSAAEAAPIPTLAERLKTVIGAAPGLPHDLAGQHDHYLHGQPKR